MEKTKKYKVILMDIGYHKKEEMVMKGTYELNDVLKVGQSGCDEFRYDTYRIEEAVVRTKRSKKS